MWQKIRNFGSQHVLICMWMSRSGRSGRLYFILMFLLDAWFSYVTVVEIFHFHFLLSRRYAVCKVHLLHFNKKLQNVYSKKILLRASLSMLLRGCRWLLRKEIKIEKSFFFLLTVEQRTCNKTTFVYWMINRTFPSQNMNIEWIFTFDLGRRQEERKSFLSSKQTNRQNRLSCK